MKLDGVALASVIDILLDLSMDVRLPPKSRKKCLVSAKQLRGNYLNLVTARFDEGTKKLSDANAQLQKVNTQLRNAKAYLDQAVAALASVARLGAILDELLKIAAKFL